MGECCVEQRSETKISAQPEQQQSTLHTDIVIVGAGIAGLATALALRRTGLECLVLERADSLRTSGTSIGLWANAWRALEVLGIAECLRSDYININRMEVLDKDGNSRREMDFQDNTRWNHELRCVERKHLLEELARPLPAGTIRVNSRVLSIHRETNFASTTIIKLEDGTNIFTKVLVGCDGAQSLVSESLGLSPQKLAGYYTIRGVATYPDGHNFGPVFQQIVGDGVRAGIAPIDETRLYWFISNETAPEVPHAIYESKDFRRQALDLLQGFPNLIIKVVKRTHPETMIASTIRLRWLWPHDMMGPSFSQGGVTVAGDAMHSMPPDLAQGGCCALEDAEVLARWLSKAMKQGRSVTGDAPRQVTNAGRERMEIAEALRRYAKERRERVWAHRASAAGGEDPECELHLLALPSRFRYPP